MININLDTNKELKEGLLRLGFKKKCGSFLRDYNESLQKLGMPYATHGEKQTRYYGCSCGFSYPEASSIAEEIGVMLCSTGGNAGYVIPQRNFFFQKPKYQYLENWKITSVDSDRYVHRLVCKILSQIETYVIPHLNMFSTKEAFIDILENSPQKCTFSYDRKLPPILYYLMGDKEKAERYIKMTLEEYKKKEENRKTGIEIIETKEYWSIIYTGGSSYKSYLEFAEKFTAYMDKQQ